LSPTQITNYWP